MLKTIMLTAAGLMAVPALAAAPGAADPPATAGPATDPADQAGEPAAPTESATPDAIAAKVNADWAKYDPQGSGHLSSDAFANWMNDLRSAGGELPADPGATDEAFAQADRDGDTKISKDEMVAYFN